MSDHGHPDAEGTPPPPAPSVPEPRSPHPPDVVDPQVAVVLDAVPEFVPLFGLLVEEFDDDPGPAVVLIELADFVAGLVARGGDPGVVERALAAVETVARSEGDGGRLVTDAFLDRLAEPERRQLSPWFGPLTRARLADLRDDDSDGVGDAG